MFPSFILFIFFGALAEVLAGLLGIGGGLVPILVFTLPMLGVPHEYLMNLALGTSLASIIFTSISSMIAHNRRGAVQWGIGIFRDITPGILAGTFIGALATAWMPTNVLKGVFLVFLYYAAWNMLFSKKSESSRQLPSTPGMVGAGE